jgi:hypothetical protein
VKREDLTATGADGSPYPARTFFYDRNRRLGIWWLDRPLGRDRITLNLDGDPGGVSGPSGLLDGDGDGVPGGDFRRTLNVLPGDVNRDGTVLANDAAEVKQKFFTRAPFVGAATDGYDFFHDVNGDGFILADDFSEVKRRFFDRLPDGNASALVL